MKRISLSGRIAAALAVTGTVLAATGCRDAQEFRSVAGDSLQVGMQAIATGLIDGLFAVYDPDPDPDAT